MAKRNSNATSAGDGTSSSLLRFLFLLPLLLIPFGGHILRPRYAVPPPIPSNAILITGASTGLGRHAAEHLSSLGFTVYGTYRSPSDASSLQSSGVTPILMDVTSRSSILDAKNAIEQDLKANNRRLYALVNNAGVGCEGPLEVLPVSEVRSMFEVNVFGLLEVTQVFLPLLREGAKACGSARIANVGSLAGVTSQKLNGAYHSTKWAVETLSDSLRQELSPQNIHVSVIEPGAVESEIASKLALRTRQCTAVVAVR